MLVPIYRLLVDEENKAEQDQREKNPNVEDVEGAKKENDGKLTKGCLSGKGGDKPTDRPLISPTDKIKGRNASNMSDYDIIDQLIQMAEKAGDTDTVAKINEWVRLERNRRHQAKAQAISMTGKGGIEQSNKPADEQRKKRGELIWDRAKEDNAGIINTLRRKLETTLRNNAADDWETGLSRGQLDMGIAYTSLNGNVNIYRERNNVGAVDYTFGIIVDKSGSQRNRIRQVFDSCVIVAEATERAVSVARSPHSPGPSPPPPSRFAFLP
jgi:hypothetical protein